MDASEEVKITSYQSVNNTDLSMNVYIPAYPSLDPPFVCCPPIDPRAPPTDLRQVEIMGPSIELQVGLSKKLRQLELWGTVIFVISILLIVLISLTNRSEVYIL
jgi:hypothetical protein